MNFNVSTMIRTEAQRVSPEQVKESYSLMSKFAYLFWEGREVIKGDARMYARTISLSPTRRLPVT